MIIFSDTFCAGASFSKRPMTRKTFSAHRTSEEHNLKEETTLGPTGGGKTQVSTHTHTHAHTGSHSRTHYTTHTRTHTRAHMLTLTHALH
jgi:hypothetical protein